MTLLIKKFPSKTTSVIAAGFEKGSHEKALL